MNVQQQIQNFIFEQFPRAKQAGLADNESLVETGIIDSMGVLEIVTFLEAEFDIVLDDDEVAGDNFESIAALTAFTENKIACQSV